MQQITGHRPTLPPRLNGLMTKPERISVVRNDLAAIESFIESHARAVRGGAA
jgi:threonine synthase